MPKFVVYEIWTKSKVVEAQDLQDAYELGEPSDSPENLSLCNWHVQLVPEYDATT